MECQRCTETANTLITSNEAGGLKLCPSCWNIENPGELSGIAVYGTGETDNPATPRKRATAKTK